MTGGTGGKALPHILPLPLRERVGVRGYQGMTKGPEQAFCHSPRLQPPSVIPEVVNRESTASPCRVHTNKGTKNKDTGFPLRQPADMTGGLEQGQWPVANPWPVGPEQA